MLGVARYRHILAIVIYLLLEGGTAILLALTFRSICPVAHKLVEHIIRTNRHSVNLITREEPLEVAHDALGELLYHLTAAHIALRCNGKGVVAHQELHCQGTDIYGLVAVGVGELFGVGVVVLHQFRRRAFRLAFLLVLSRKAVGEANQGEASDGRGVVIAQRTVARDYMNGRIVHLQTNRVAKLLLYLRTLSNLVVEVFHRETLLLVLPMHHTIHAWI